MNAKPPDEESHSENTEGTDRATRLDEMKSNLEWRTKSQPESAEAWRELTPVKMALGDIEGAEDDRIEYLHIDPKNAPGLVLTSGRSEMRSESHVDVTTIVRGGSCCGRGCVIAKCGVGK